MKIALIYVCLMLSVVSLQAQSPPALTANFYILAPEKYLDKPISLSVATVYMTDVTEVKDGYKEVKVYTCSNGADGGYINVLATPDALSRLVKLCGTATYEYISSYRPHVVQGVFVKDGSHYAVKIEK